VLCIVQEVRSIGDGLNAIVVHINFPQLDVKVKHFSVQHLELIVVEKDDFEEAILAEHALVNVPDAISAERELKQIRQLFECVWMQTLNDIEAQRQMLQRCQSFECIFRYVCYFVLSQIERFQHILSAIESRILQVCQLVMSDVNVGNVMSEEKVAS